MLGKILQVAVYALSQHPVYDAFSPIAKIHGFIHQWVEMAPALLTITPNDPLAGVFLTVPATICSAGLEALVPKGRWTLPPGGTTIISLNWKLRLQPVHLGLLIPLNQ